MKIFRSIALCLGMAVVGAIEFASRMVEPLVHYVASGCDALASGMDKLKRELVHYANRDVGVGAGISSGFRRESNGFRQATAKDGWDDLILAT